MAIPHIDVRAVYLCVIYHYNFGSRHAELMKNKQNSILTPFSILQHCEFLKTLHVKYSIQLTYDNLYTVAYILFLF